MSGHPRSWWAAWCERSRDGARRLSRRATALWCTVMRRIRCRWKSPVGFRAPQAWRQISSTVLGAPADARRGRTALPSVPTSHRRNDRRFSGGLRARAPRRTRGPPDRASPCCPRAAPPPMPPAGRADRPRSLVDVAPEGVRPEPGHPKGVLAVERDVLHERGHGARIAAPDAESPATLRLPGSRLEHEVAVPGVHDDRLAGRELLV